MAMAQHTTDARVLVGIDISKNRHEVLIAAPGGMATGRPIRSGPSNSALKPKPPRGPNWRHDRRKALSQDRAPVQARGSRPWTTLHNRPAQELDPADRKR